MNKDISKEDCSFISDINLPQSLPLPPLVWILGGPGSCKASRVVKAVEEKPWTVLNFGYFHSLSQRGDHLAGRN